MFRIPLIVGAVLMASSGAALAAGPGQPSENGVPPCGPRAQIVQAMKQIFDERPQARGLISSNELFEIFVSPQGTWTMLVTNPHGISCIAAAGESWERATGQIAERLPSLD
jgi:hypothetical protein